MERAAVAFQSALADDDNLVLDALTRATLTRLASRPSAADRTTAVTDLDLDGIQEIILGGALYGTGGAPPWTETWRPATERFHCARLTWTAPVRSRSCARSTRPGTCTTAGRATCSWSWGDQQSGTIWGFASVADVDGDGYAEIAVTTTLSVGVPSTTAP